jgi:hypothetical protein
MFKTITILLLACTDCGLTKITRPFDSQKFSCNKMSEKIRLETATYNDKVNGWYTKNGMLFVGTICH